MRLITATIFKQKRGGATIAFGRILAESWDGRHEAEAHATKARPAHRPLVADVVVEFPRTGVRVTSTAVLVTRTAVEATSTG